jgi:hypothetical protein
MIISQCNYQLLELSAELTEELELVEESPPDSESEPELLLLLPLLVDDVGMQRRALDVLRWLPLPL